MMRAPSWNRWGRPVRPNRLTERLHGYLDAAGVGKSGSCHIWRHTTATLMHEGGADIRDIQEMLGHQAISSTAIYTHVSVRRLKLVHRRTHPAGLGAGGGPPGWPEQAPTRPASLRRQFGKAPQAALRRFALRFAARYGCTAACALPFRSGTGRAACRRWLANNPGIIRTCPQNTCVWGLRFPLARYVIRYVNLGHRRGAGAGSSNPPPQGGSRLPRPAAPSYAFAAPRRTLRREPRLGSVSLAWYGRRVRAGLRFGLPNND